MKRKLSWKKIIIVITLLIVIPWVYFNLKYYTGKPILTAGREIAFCYEELTLKDNNTFIDNTTCYMNDRIRGAYTITNDTIYFEGFTTDKTSYKYGLIENSLYGKVLNLYDASGHFEKQLSITFNHLKR